MNYNPSDDGTVGTTRGICPAGWHLPTENEWLTLINYLGGNQQAGGKLKETGIVHWKTPNEELLINQVLRHCQVDTGIVTIQVEIMKAIVMVLIPEDFLDSNSS